MRLIGPTRDTLWTLIAAPTIWGAHFIFSYLLAAYRCAPNGDPFEPIGGVRMAIGGAALVSLALILLVFRRAWREWRGGGGNIHAAGDSEAVRERFLEFSTLLLAALSFAAVVFDTVPVMLLTDCR